MIKNERRITPPHEGDNKLKAIAGLFQKLSYREMHELVVEMKSNINVGMIEPMELAEGLLNVADAILSKDPVKSDAAVARNTPTAGGWI